MKRYVTLTATLVVVSMAGCGVGKDKYADLSCQQLKKVEREQASLAHSFTSAFQRDPTKANEESIKAAQANVFYARDAYRENKCAN